MPNPLPSRTTTVKALKDTLKTLKSVEEFQVELNQKLDDQNQRVDQLLQDLDQASDDTSVTMLPEDERNELRTKLMKIFHKREQLGITLYQTIEYNNLLKQVLEKTKNRLFPPNRPSRRRTIGGKSRRMGRRTHKKKRYRS